ncbi:MAG: hypothetical protein FJX76_02070 [Armatimonadetes bacterium]|nr:hypothetical protein [Armatimonadota bacterium]
MRNAAGRDESAHERAARRISCEVTLIAHTRRASRPTLGRLRALATIRTRTVIVVLPESAGSPEPINVTRWSELVR